MLLRFCCTFGTAPLRRSRHVQGLDSRQCLVKSAQ
jgi:hypothetical protein